MSEKNVKLTTANSIQAFIEQVIAEGIKSALAQSALTEKEKQVKTAGEPPEEEGGSNDDLFGGGGDDSEGEEGGDDDEGDNQSSKTMDDETEKLKDSDIEPKDIVEKLNSIRAGKSFKDEQVAKAMEEYIGSMSKAEKVALFAFMKGIAGIVTGEVSGEQAEDPSKNPSDVKMQKGDGPEKVRHMKPNVIKGPQKPKKGNASAEDTSSPAPITPKRR